MVEYICEIWYLEASNTFMSADLFHHQVEQALHKKEKSMISVILLSVNNANSKNVDVIVGWFYVSA